MGVDLPEPIANCKVHGLGILLRALLQPAHAQTAIKFVPVLWLHSTAKPVDYTAIALRRLAFPQRFEMRHGFALFRQLQPQLTARLCLTVERLGNRRWAAHLTEDEHLHLKVAAVVLHL